MAPVRANRRVPDPGLEVGVRETGVDRARARQVDLEVGPLVGREGE
ncbi:hypothetical protein [Natronobacterium haloterrestre]|nr:hypothetical protein [Halobiforma haloterrestris]